MSKYPTEWSHGIPRGYIVDRGSNFLLNITDKNGKPHRYTYKCAIFKTKAACLKHVEGEKIYYSHKFGVTRNEIRFTDKNTIEVKINLIGKNKGKVKIFQTDAKHFEMVHKYSLQAVLKRERKVQKYYIYYQDKKKRSPFTDLIVNYTTVHYINGDTLDLREKNLREVGLGMKIVDEINNEDNDDGSINNITVEDVSKYYYMNINHLPRNEWILGSVNGTIFYRKQDKNKVLTMNVKDDENNKKKCKIFRVENYGSPDKTFREAQKYMINYAHQNNLSRNKIRILDDYLEVMLDLNGKYIMKTDLMYLPLFIPQQDTCKSFFKVYKTKAPANNKKYAAIYDLNNKELYRYHSFIMGGSMIDHINGDSLDNRLENLRFTNHVHNMQNKKSTTDLEYGVYYNKNNDSYCAQMGTADEFFCKEYEIQIYGKKNAKKLATRYRKNILEVNFTIDEFTNLDLTYKDLPALRNSLKRTKKYLKDMQDRMPSIDDYLPNVENTLDMQYKIALFDQYIYIQSFRITDLRKRIDNLKTAISTC